MPLPFILWSNWPASAIYTAQLAVFIALAIIFTLPAIRFRIVPRRRKHERAHAEAMSQFFAHGLQKTAQRTGVLIFAAEAERYAEIVADAGINEKVSPEVWDDAVAALTAAIAVGRAGRRLRRRDREMRRGAGQAFPARGAGARRIAGQTRRNLTAHLSSQDTSELSCYLTIQVAVFRCVRGRMPR